MVTLFSELEIKIYDLEMNLIVKIEIVQKHPLYVANTKLTLWASLP